jgi:type I restriction enzyme M protein
MTEIFELENHIKQIIDQLKGLCQTNGLSNQASEEEVITTVFLYKFLNDKFMYNLKEFADDIDMDYKEVLKNENDELYAFYDSYPQDVAFTYDETIEYLINKVSQDNFYSLFDDALEKISNDSKNEVFSIETADVNGDRIIKTKTLTNIKSSASNDDIMAVVNAISNLQKHTLSATNRVDNSSLSE